MEGNFPMTTNPTGIRLWFGVLGFVAVLCRPGTAQVNQELAAQYFEEAKTLCEREGGRHWGIRLCGPMVFVDPLTKTIASNMPTPDAERPRALGFANTALDWGGVRWSTYVWQGIPQGNARQRGRLMLHELFHRIQPSLDLMPGTGKNDHLDTLEGRYWLQLEWRALAEALRTSGTERTAAMRDALAFRQKRRTVFPDSAKEEQPEEIREGLAQYTGTIAATADAAAAAADVIDQLTAAVQQPTFVRTFAYSSGAAYGVLLDAVAPGWTRRVKATDDLGTMLMTAANIDPSSDLSAAEKRFSGATLRTAEEQRELQRQARVAELKQRFVDGPVLIVPRASGASFITTGSTPIPGAGSTLAGYRLTASWGSLEADMILVSDDGETLRLPAPHPLSGKTFTGDGWTVTLAAGWTLQPGPRPGDFTVIREDR
jgi:hypothetical protein